MHNRKTKNHVTILSKKPDEESKNKRNEILILPRRNQVDVPRVADNPKRNNSNMLDMKNFVERIIPRGNL